MLRRIAEGVARFSGSLDASEGFRIEAELFYRDAPSATLGDERAREVLGRLKGMTPLCGVVGFREVDAYGRNVDHGDRPFCALPRDALELFVSGWRGGWRDAIGGARHRLIPKRV